MGEFSLSSVPAADQPFDHNISAAAVASAASPVRVAPFTANDAPGKVWNVAATERSD